MSTLRRTADAVATCSAVSSGAASAAVLAEVPFGAPVLPREVGGPVHLDLHLPVRAYDPEGTDRVHGTRASR